jgi:hypothetical protein
MFSPGASVSSYITDCPMLSIEPIMSQVSKLVLCSWFNIGITRSPLKSHRFSDLRNSVSMKTLFKLIKIIISDGTIGFSIQSFWWNMACAFFSKKLSPWSVNEIPFGEKSNIVTMEKWRKCNEIYPDLLNYEDTNKKCRRFIHVFDWYPDLVHCLILVRSLWRDIAARRLLSIKMSGLM